MEKILIVQVAAWGWDLASRHTPPSLKLQKMEAVFPALTCTAQAAFRTGSLAAQHGMVANGLYHRELHRAMFWEQSADLVLGPRLWDRLRIDGKKVGLMFWQQSLGESADLILSPAPIHKHHGGMIQDCYSRPAGLYERLVKKIGRPFNLMHYWGPLASAKASEWIAEAVEQVLLDQEFAPDVLLTYLPHLDYDLQRYGPDSPQAVRALSKLNLYLERLKVAAEQQGYDYLFWGDYAMGAVKGGVVCPNVALREAGLFETRSIKGMAYPDFHVSRAWALVDHEVAHVYVRNPADISLVRGVVEKMKGVQEVLDRGGQARWGVAHERSGELVLVAQEGYWFAYPWWVERSEAPDFASHVDIHNKPGYDPCELFFGWPPMSVGLNPARIRGSHGRVGVGREVAWASSLSLNTPPQSIPDVAREIFSHLIAEE